MARFVAALLIAVVTWSSASAQDGARLALLIGNEDYPAAPGRLARPHADVRALSQALEEAGFAVTPVLDADQRAIEQAVADFAAALSEAGPSSVGFLYYGGHGGVAVSGGVRRNYMLPARERIATAAELAQRGVRLDLQIDALENAGAGALFVVYDACRNEFARGSRGFEPVAQRPRMLIAMSTMADATTPDDGAYALALAAEIRRDGQNALTAFARAVTTVGAARPADQLPMFYPGVSPDFCFLSCTSAAPAASRAPSATGPSLSIEVANVDGGLGWRWNGGPYPNERIEETLNAYLREHGLLAQNTAAYRLNARLVETNSPSGFDLRVTAVVNYQLVENASNAIIFEGDITAIGLSRFNESLNGYERAGLARDAAIEATLNDLIERVSATLAYRAAPADAR